MSTKKPEKSELTLKQRRFVEAYMGEAGGNATQAAELAGYSGDRHTLEVMGCQNLRNHKILGEMARIFDESPLKLSRQARFSLLTKMALDPKTDDRDILGALRIYAQMMGDNTERQQIQVTGEDLYDKFRKRIRAINVQEPTEEKGEGELH